MEMCCLVLMVILEMIFKFLFFLVFVFYIILLFILSFDRIYLKFGNVWIRIVMLEEN